MQSLLLVLSAFFSLSLVVLSIYYYYLCDLIDDNVSFTRVVKLSNVAFSNTVIPVNVCLKKVYSTYVILENITVVDELAYINIKLKSNKINTKSIKILKNRLLNRKSIYEYPWIRISDDKGKVLNLGYASILSYDKIKFNVVAYDLLFCDSIKIEISNLSILRRNVVV